MSFPPFSEVWKIYQHIFLYSFPQSQIKSYDSYAYCKNMIQKSSNVMRAFLKYETLRTRVRHLQEKHQLLVMDLVDRMSSEENLLPKDF